MTQAVLRFDGDTFNVLEMADNQKLIEELRSLRNAARDRMALAFREYPETPTEQMQRDFAPLQMICTAVDDLLDELETQGGDGVLEADS